MMIWSCGNKTDEYKILFTRGKHGEIIKAETIFHKSFLKNRKYMYDSKLNKMVENPLFKNL